MFSWLRSCNTKRLMINISIWTHSLVLSHTHSLPLFVTHDTHSKSLRLGRHFSILFSFMIFLLYFFFGYFSRKFSFTHFTRLCFYSCCCLSKLLESRAKGKTKLSIDLQTRKQDRSGIVRGVDEAKEVYLRIIHTIVVVVVEENMATIS